MAKTPRAEVKEKDVVVVFTATAAYKPDKEALRIDLDDAFNHLDERWFNGKPNPAVTTTNTGLRLELSTRVSIKKCTQREFRAALRELRGKVERLMTKK